MLGLDLKAARVTWTAAAVLLLLCVIYLTRQTLFIFAVALMFAYLLYPLFDAIDRHLRSVSRIAALALTYGLVVAVIGGLGVFVGSHVGGEAAQLAAAVRRPGFEAQVRNWHVMNIAVGDLLIRHYTEIAGAIPNVTLKVLSASTNLVDIVIVPILSFFILKDGRAIRDSFLEMIDTGQKAAEDALADAHTLMLQYMRALLFLCIATLITFSIVLSVMRVPYAVLLASIAFPLEFVPLVGPLSAAVIILGVSFFSGYPHVLWVFVFLMIYRMFQDYALSPHLMSKGVALHPLLVIFGVFAGGEIGGVPGIFLSVPVLALLRLLYHRLRKSRVISPSSQTAAKVVLV